MDYKYVRWTTPRPVYRDPPLYSRWLPEGTPPLGGIGGLGGIEPIKTVQAPRCLNGWRYERRCEARVNDPPAPQRHTTTRNRRPPIAHRLPP